jgi:hypothetical protein
MKTNLLKYYIAAFYFCSTFVMVAQPGTGNGETGDGSLEGADETATPVDGYVWVFALIGLLFVFLKFRDVYKRGADLQA